MSRTHCHSLVEWWPFADRIPESWPGRGVICAKGKENKDFLVGAGGAISNVRTFHGVLKRDVRCSEVGVNFERRQVPVSPLKPNR